GPAVEALAATVPSTPFHLPVARLEGGGYDFSFSGLKTAVAELAAREPGVRAAVARALEEAVVAALVRTTARALEAYPAAALYVAGGVAANRRLRGELEALCHARGVVLGLPPPALCTDNAAMVAAAGYYRFRRGEFLGRWESAETPWPLPAAGS
ncbi:MAG: tRNA (adenosine(37)-N6)-threonylcarbamoyltransferase complex transferase subunit TsaD, partial [Firmicutes bacterium]|nr:tRNA (adenosine(37)-N6)-threonylcarbamoyltransferase complex transferase subunit TsaD [Bacillota bacterium]